MSAPRNLIISTDDFVGFQNLALSNDTIPVLQSFIDLYEKRYLVWLLSETMAGLFITDAQNNNGIPIIPRFVALFNPFDKQDLENNLRNDDNYYDGGKGMRHSDGIKQILLNCVFYHFVFDTEQQHSQTGVTNNVVDTSTKGDAYRYAERRFNHALDSWEDLKWFIMQDPVTYPEYVKTVMPKAKFSPIL